MQHKAKNSEIEKTINEYFMWLKSIANELSIIETEWDKKLQELELTYAHHVKGLKEKYAEVEKELIKYAKSKKAELFKQKDIFESAQGRLIRELAEKVSIPRDAISKCEENGFFDVIRISKSLDRAAVEKWPDERLFLIGAKRERVEKIDYELK